MATQILELLFKYWIAFKSHFWLFICTIITFLTPIHGLIITITLAVGLDTITGIYASVKKKGWKKGFESHKLFNIVSKTFMYVGTIMLMFCLDKFLFDGSIMNIKYLLAKVVTVVWIYFEAKSVDENLVKVGFRSFGEILMELFNKVLKLKKNLNELKKDE